MQDWRFDDLTRTLGTATTRRGVLKGLLTGIAAVVVGHGLKTVPSAEAAPANCLDGNHVRQCKAEAWGLWRICVQNCQQLAGHRGYFHESEPQHQEGVACLLGCEIALKEEAAFCEETGCIGDCCSGQCTHLANDPQNCGACGHACPQGATCSGGQCQCPDGLISCNEDCVNTQIDKNNCGSCGHACDTCETCSGGTCVPTTCPEGYVCCQDNCILACSSGDLPDPQTCQCNVCKDQINGAACGSNLICCNEQCVSNQCPSPKIFDDQSCGCVCPPANCGSGQLQDPDTCQCITVDLCANVTCGTCQTCDPASGACVQVADQTSCGNGQVCCSGTCQDTCGTCAGLPCANGDCCTNSTDFACCEDGCCPQVTVNGQTNAYCVAAGSVTGPLGNPVGNCCAPADLIKLSVIDPTTNQCGCGSGAAFQVACAGNLPPDAFGITYCSCGPWF